MNDYYPGTNWEHDDRGWDRAALAIVLESARELNSTDIAVVHRGRLVADARWQPGPVAAAEVVESLPDGPVRQDIDSAQKSVSSVLAAIAVGRGLLDINSPVSAHLGKGWAGPKAPPSEERITVRHLLTMTSGLADDMSFVAEPGTRWDYNLGPAYHTVKRVLAAAAGSSIDELTASWLTGPLGMTASGWVRRTWREGTPELLRPSFQYPDGEPIEGFVTTAQDLARFGLAVLRGCMWNGTALGADPNYAAAMVRPSQPFNPAYGYLWWLNGQDRYLAPKNETVFEGSFFPNAPGDTFGALGAMDRMCVVIPSLDLVITRSGGLAQERSAAGSAFVRSLVASVCAAHPLRRLP
ncbi:MAG: beta-lactamase family protein [Dehalococcoidia bacterium]|uniref:serine hydrolase domain-containing protein n=1 Tax=Candidatus Amarobacter glycogenicus TaxID=3140699 RepID=UPI003135EFD9|nr:beta-lactamase family protein [Dehalococcoidia bacterium]